MTRRIINLILALVLTVTGGIGSIYMLFFAAAIPFKAAGAARLVHGLGLIWLYSDFVDATPNDQQR
jgi:hypothetical protein